ncbi:MAG: hypothetical protein JWP57_1184 [Spirosoma sp.]|nr:hypothetical protein [Spirosoma sp.]
MVIFILLTKSDKAMTLITETTFDFKFIYTPGEPATRDYPGSGPEVTVTEVRLNGVTIPLEAITSEMWEQMIEQVNEQYD